MTDQFKQILDTLVAEGFQQLTDKTAAQDRDLDYRITPYSLNTKLSFRFDSIDHFIEFLKLSNPMSVEKKIAVLHTTFTELGLNPKDFFYVNFFDAVKDEDL